MTHTPDHHPPGVYEAEQLARACAEPPRRPWLCPVCSGTGMRPAGFYGGYGAFSSPSASAEVCRACAGQGFIVV